MKKQPWCSFLLAGVSLTDYGLEIPSPFTSLELNNSEINSFTSWTLSVVVGGDRNRKMNVAAFEALLYSSAQSAYSYANASGIPVSFMFGWLDDNGNITEYTSYQGYTLKFQVSMADQFLKYDVSGYASVAIQSSMPVLNIPAITGVVQPSAVVEALATSVKATSYYDLDIDHTDAPTLVSHGAMTTSFRSYVRGTYSSEDDYNSFPGLLKLAKTYSGARQATGLKSQYKNLSSIINNRIDTPVRNFLKDSLVDCTPQATSFSFWIDEPTMTQPGVIHFKNNASLNSMQLNDTLIYGGARPSGTSRSTDSATNIISISGSYNGVVYNMTDMSFASVGFAVDGSGNSIVEDYHVVNSWSSSLAQVFQTVDIINDINALASQFSGTFTLQIVGNVSQYELAQPVSVVVMSGNTVSPISGIYNIISVSHSISSTFITTLKVQRLVMSSANQVATQQGILVSNSAQYSPSSYKQTKNVISSSKVDLGTIYPTFEHIASN